MKGFEKLDEFMQLEIGAEGFPLPLRRAVFLRPSGLKVA
jgi:hypothetical protein